MKITKLTTYIVPPRWMFLKIETDEGIVGLWWPVYSRAHRYRDWRSNTGSTQTS